MGMIEKQAAFAGAAARLIIHINETPGHLCTLGDAYRDPRVFGEFGACSPVYGRARSCHKLRLAIDLNLFIYGIWRTETEAFREFGEWWERVYAHEDAAWGGHHEDGNHFSFRCWGSA